MFIFFLPEGWFTTLILHSNQSLAFSLSPLKILILASLLICPVYEFRRLPAVFFPSIIPSNIILCVSSRCLRFFFYYSSKNLFICFPFYPTCPLHTPPTPHFNGFWFLFSASFLAHVLHPYAVTLQTHVLMSFYLILRLCSCCTYLLLLRARTKPTLGSLCTHQSVFNTWRRCTRA